MKSRIQPLWERGRTRAARFFADHPNIKAIVSNVGWLSFDTVIRLVLGLFLGTWVARYLQPSYFGELNYALALVTLISAPAGLGLVDIVVRDLIKAPDDATKLLGTAFISRMIAGVISYASVFFYALSLPNSVTRSLLLISALALCIQALTVAGLRFKADLRSRELVIGGNIGFAISALFRVYLVLARRPLIEFAWVAVVEGMIAAMVTLVLYSKSYRDLRQWRFTFSTAGRLLHESWPLILSALAITIYMRIDQVMIAQMLGSTQVGLYTAATKLSEITYIVPNILAAALFPSIVRSKGLGPERYAARMQSYYDMNAGLAYCLILPLSLASPVIIHLLYGKGYESSASVLTVQVWALLFVYLGLAKEQFLLAEGFLRFSFVSALLGAILNIAINLLLIPRYGGVGAAWATILAQAVTNVIAPFFYTPTRPMSLQLYRAIFLPFRIWGLLHSKRDLLSAPTKHGN